MAFPLSFTLLSLKEHSALGEHLQEPPEGRGCGSEWNVDEGGRIHGDEENTGDIKNPEGWEVLALKHHYLYPCT